MKGVGTHRGKRGWAERGGEPKTEKATKNKNGWNGKKRRPTKGGREQLQPTNKKSGVGGAGGGTLRQNEAGGDTNLVNKKTRGGGITSQNSEGDKGDNPITRNSGQ